MASNQAPDADAGDRYRSTAPFDATRGYPRNACIHQVFRAIAEHAPDAVALDDGRRTMTYSEVELATNSFARHLASLGLKQGGIAGFLTTRSIETVLGYLAALKCGACYMPLDPDYPDRALALPVAEAAPDVLLAQPSCFDVQRAVAGRTVLDLNQEIARARCRPDGPPEQAGRSHRTAHDPAYIMYTSGSTGRPKGVVVPHRGVVRLVRGQDVFELGRGDCTLFTTALTFDVSARDIWGALLTGGRLAIPSGPRLGVDEMADAIERFGVTTINTTAALFHLLVDHRLAALGRLQNLVVGGDVLSPVKALQAVRAHPRLRLFNAYGPTENATISTWYEVPADGWGEGPVPIGKAISHSTAYILDEHRQPVPPGESGVLWTGGDGVALGYVGRPDLTNERFQPDPFASDASALMYDTGDLARLRDDGNIEFLGRRDRQIKIAGKRIELDEIESAVRRCPGVADAAVVVQLLGGDDKRIVAFASTVAFDSTSPAPEPDLRERLAAHLRTTLPPHMLPSLLLVRDSLPVTTHGKVDRASLLQTLPGPSARPAASDDIPAGLEEELAAIWRAVLKHDAVAATDNFFDLGGRSLHMLEVHAELRRRLGVDIPVVEMFRRPTIVELCRCIRGTEKTIAGARRDERGQRQRAAIMRARAQRG